MIKEFNGYMPQYIQHISNNGRHYRHDIPDTLSYISLSTPQKTSKNKTHIIKQHTPILNKNIKDQKDTLIALLAQSK